MIDFRWSFTEILLKEIIVSLGLVCRVLVYCAPQCSAMKFVTYYFTPILVRISVLSVFVNFFTRCFFLFFSFAYYFLYL
jgi:hypothetical protein